ncbi:C-C motif chemokine 4 homolog [Engraulis encrasicolus]|uniref:C-C motif chemokine 4 homolog n=1 Tax=Engraulis encrasicolus TaxID=184585 RepID=UPI002FD57DB5
MKLCCAVAVAVLVLALCFQGDSHTATPQKCCFQYYNRPIPAKRIKGYTMTHANCPKKGVILSTVCNKVLCANPNTKHVKAIMEKIDNPFGHQTTTC